MPATDKVELRGMAPIDLAQALDAIAMAKGMDRNSYVIHVLQSEVERYLHETTVVAAALRGNPMLRRSSRNPNGKGMEP